MHSPASSVWKPLRGPLRDWPLTLCDVSSVQTEHLVEADIIYEDVVTENLQMHYDAAQRWYYLEDQEASELLVFRQTESRPGGPIGMICPSFLFGADYSQTV